jgi:hypothetical protein
METLNFLRKAKKQKDGYDGFLYLHRWDTGWQELIFNSKEDADKYIKKLNKKEKTTK